MNEGRNANKPQRRWSRPSPPNHETNPVDRAGAVATTTLPPTRRRATTATWRLSVAPVPEAIPLRPKISISTQSISCVC